jgi:2-polyprenyl-3-methyl-5-hydroxy-6-metoxy-1,4-benzoquinol methylase
MTLINKIIENRNCPTCFETLTNKTINSQTNPFDLNFEILADQFIGFRKNQCFFSYSICRKCKTAYCKNYFNQESLDTLYSRMPDNKFGLSDKTAFRTQLGYAKQIIKALKNRKKISILEIGPDLGFLTLAICQLIKVDKVTFIEPNVDVHNRLRSNFENYDFEVQILTNENQLSKLDSFDLIIGIHVLDHLINPNEQIRAYRDLLNEGGTLNFVTHNYSSLLRKILGKKWPPFCLQHPQLYSPSSFKAMANQHKFNIATSRRTTNWLDLSAIFLRFSALLGIRKRFKVRINVSIPVNLGNIITIFVKS